MSAWESVALRCRPSREAFASFGPAVVVGALAAWLAAGGCGPKPDAVAATPAAGMTTAIYLDPSRNGAVSGRPDESAGGRRTATAGGLTFVVQGSAPPSPAGVRSERRPAMTQAAVLDALAAAVIESRRAAGLPTGAFEARLGPHVLLEYKPTPAGGRDVRVQLVSRGRTTALHARDGVLQHPPYDLGVVQRVFDDTNGRYALLDARQAPARDGCIASVACYDLSPPPGDDGPPPAARSVP